MINTRFSSNSQLRCWQTMEAGISLSESSDNIWPKAPIITGESFSLQTLLNELKFQNFVVSLLLICHIRSYALTVRNLTASSV